VWIILAALAPVLLALLGVAWRLGRLEQRVSDLKDRVGEPPLQEFRVDVDRRLTRLENANGWWATRQGP